MGVLKVLSLRVGNRETKVDTRLDSQSSYSLSAYINQKN